MIVVDERQTGCYHGVTLCTLMHVLVCTCVHMCACSLARSRKCVLTVKGPLDWQPTHMRGFAATASSPCTTKGPMMLPQRPHSQRTTASCGKTPLRRVTTPRTLIRLPRCQVLRRWQAEQGRCVVVFQGGGGGEGSWRTLCCIIASACPAHAQLPSHPHSPHIIYLPVHPTPHHT